MFAAIILEKTFDKLVVPCKWIKTINCVKFVDNGVNQSQTHTVFYSFDEKVEPDFLLPCDQQEFDMINGHGCYRGRILKFFETKVEAIDYCENRREILPTAYSSSKCKDAIQWNDENPKRNDEAIPETNTEVDSKAEVRAEINCRMAAMNWHECMEIDDDDSDIEEFQSIIGHSSENEMDDTDTFVQTVSTATTREHYVVRVSVGYGDSSNSDSAISNSKDTSSIKQEELSHTDNHSDTNEKEGKEIHDMLSSLALHIPEKYPFSIINKKIFFKDIDVSLKTSFGAVIIGWNNNTLGFTSVFYDGKFVDVLLLAVFKKEELIGHEKLDNKKMRFVKDIFIQRVKGNPDRCMRFGDYIQKRREELRNRQVGNKSRN